MKNRLVQTENFRKLIGTSLGVICLSLLVWTGIEVYHRYLHSSEESIVLIITPFLISYGFFFIGIISLIRKYRLPIVSFFFLVAATLAVGYISVENDLAARIFLIFLVWNAPSIFCFHITWLGISISRYWTLVYQLIIILSGILSAPFLILKRLDLHQLGWFSILHVATRAIFIFGLLNVLVLLVVQYRYTKSHTVRAKIRLVLLGTILGTAPLTLLSILPNLLKLDYLPYEVSFPFLLFIPLFYGYTIYRSRLSSLENRFTSFASLYLIAIITFEFFWISSKFLSFLFPQWKSSWSYISAFIMSLIILLFPPFRESLNRFIFWVFNGEETLIVQTISEVSNLLFQARSGDRLRELLVGDLPDRLCLSGGVLFLKEKNGHLYSQESDWLRHTFSRADGLHLESNSSIIKKLEQHSGVLENSILAQLLSNRSLSKAEQAILKIGEMGIWLLLKTPEDIQGILLLGPRSIEEGSFTAIDRNVFKIFALQAAVAIQHIRILEEVLAGRDELARAHHQLLAAREEERFYLARELHDQVIQQLIGISYQIQQIQKQIDRTSQFVQVPAHLYQVRQEILDIVSFLRNIIQDIRPVGIEVFGLVKTIEDYILRLQKQYRETLQITYVKPTEDEPEISDQVRINLFRVVQEAVRNSIKHAHATHISIKILFSANEVQIEIEDNGGGFVVPMRISEFAQKGCFGLVGILERVDGLKGTVNVASRIDEGTKIIAKIPLEHLKTGSECSKGS